MCRLAYRRAARGLSVTNNPALLDFSGLKVSYAGADFTVVGNESLTSLKGLEKVTLLAWTVNISRNAKLASLSALSAVTEIRSTITISDNPLLPSCAIDALLTPLAQTCTCTGNDAAATCP